MHCPVMRYHGGKHRIAEWVIQHFPRHQVYVEPFGGAASVLMRKPSTPAEVYNDLDGEVVNVFRVLRDPESAERLAQACRFTPYARDEFDLSQESDGDPVEQARRTLFRSWASFGSAGASGGNSGMRTYTRPDGAHLGVAHAWARIADMIPAFCDRFRSVVIENRPAIDVMGQHDTRETVHYIDPPYLPETRSQGSSRYYRHEMAIEDHEALLDTVRHLRGFVVISGYDSALYNNRLPGWTRVALPTSGSGRLGSVKRTECLWLSPRTAEHQRQRDMFATA
ncbi:DNA adenine methylase [Halomonas sp. OfavH-34-E]|uniref:DNA adenine methylase n=1 Tax=Halomonas sp. OfavH-34-E TaxID=2954491 RepID=UPI0020986453|nr:DNA adenine methylase [Halomonas sp. OfavH-34-E]MCO7218116.1 DNA adenine methylase [Halomonas sp. OfavH-34-E]